MHYDGLIRTFILTKYSETDIKSAGDIFGQIQSVKDLTEQYKTAYPNVELAYPSHVISRVP